MTKNNFTDKAHWARYWDHYRFDKVPQRMVYGPFVERLSKGKSFIEIGGFPGIHAAYFYQKGVKDTTILDFHIDPRVVRGFEKANAIPEGAIHCIESDFFAFSPDRTYDVVFSSGFAEHFEDTEDVIRRHAALLSDEGQLLILIPNFLGLNGAIQRWFDKANLEAHNVVSMEIERLRLIVKRLELRETQVTYLGKPMVWLEPKPENKRYLSWIKLLSYALKLIPVKGKLLSPYIAIYARK